jgi:hypothetical protein
MQLFKIKTAKPLLKGVVLLLEGLGKAVIIAAGII